MRKLKMSLWREETGSITIEAVLWLPVFILLLKLSVDASSLMASQTRLYSIASDASRMVSLGTMSKSQAETWAETTAGGGEGINFTITQTSNSVTTNAAMSFNEAPGLGVLTVVGGTIRASAVYRREPSS